MSNPAPFHETTSPFDADQATLSNYTEIRTTHIDLEWAIDWTAQIIHGHATVELTAVKDVEEVILDASYLKVDHVQVQGKEVKWELGERIGVMGEGLHVHLSEKLKAGESVKLEIKYSTTKECTAVGWLTPAQTKSGKYPYLYSQSQAIHARSLLPCQDTPAIKASWSSRVKSVLPVLMSGLRISPPSEEILKPGKEVEYVYDQPVAIPSYLVAIASGELVYRAFDKLPGKEWRTGCWAEPATIDAAHEEFKDDTAHFVENAEKFTSSYKFGVYDILFLPNSFPYGGMENCCLTFATPTIIAGDKSEVDVGAHEISHSWFGNGIGCASWCHFWLNESWTTYLERLLIGQTNGEPARQLSFLIGRKGLREDLKRYQEAGEPRFQRLVTEYKQHEDPDEGYSQVAYEKGSNLLLHIERLVGGLDVFIPYMKDYEKTFTGTSITTDQWRSHLFHYFGTLPDGQDMLKKLGQIDWDAWIHGDGTDLCVDIQYDDTLSKQCFDLADKWDKSRDTDFSQFSPSDVASFLSAQKKVFLDALDVKPDFSPKVVAALGKTYGFDRTENAEIRNRFYRIALKSGPEYAEQAAAWVIDKGRMKFCRTTFRGIFSQNPELAKKTFLKHAAFYHPIARKMIARDLGVEVDSQAQE